MTNRLAHLFFGRALAALLVVAAVPSLAGAEPKNKLDNVLRDRSTRLAGSSRVIVEFVGDPDVRALGRGKAGRRVGARGQVAEIDNTQLLILAADARVAGVWADRPAFPTLERTGAAIGATIARDRFGVTGSGVGVAVIDSGITSHHDDLYDGHRTKSDTSVVHFKDFVEAQGQQRRQARRRLRPRHPRRRHHRGLRR